MLRERPRGISQASVLLKLKVRCEPSVVVLLAAIDPEIQLQSAQHNARLVHKGVAYAVTNAP